MVSCRQPSLEKQLIWPSELSKATEMHASCFWASYQQKCAPVLTEDNDVLSCYISWNMGRVSVGIVATSSRAPFIKACKVCQLPSSFPVKAHVNVLSWKTVILHSQSRSFPAASAS